MQTARFVLVGTITIFIVGCFGSKKPTLPKDAFPQTVGKYQAGEVKFGGLNGEDGRASYSTTEGKFIKLMSYSAVAYENADAARKYHQNVSFCSRKNIKPITEQQDSGTECLKEDDLKDKSGKVVGLISIGKMSEVKAGSAPKVRRYLVDYIYDDWIVSLRDDWPIGDKKYMHSLGELIAFMKDLPRNSKLDFTALNLEPLIAENKIADEDQYIEDKPVSAEGLAKLSLPDRLTKQPYLKGKTAVAYGSLFVSSYEGIDKKLLVRSIEEAQSIIKIDCEEGEKIGTYYGGINPVDAYSNKCVVSIIDNTIPAVISRRTFINKSLPKEIKRRVEGGGRYVPPDPPEIESFLQKLPRK